MQGSPLSRRRVSLSVTAATSTALPLFEKQIAAGCATVMQKACKALPAGARAHARAPLAAETLALLEAAWAERVEPATGLGSYAEMAAALAKDHEPWVRAE